MIQGILRGSLLGAASLAFASSLAVGENLKNVNVASDQNGVTVKIEIASFASSTIRMLDRPARIAICFPDMSFEAQTRTIPVRRNGVEEIRIEAGCGSQSGTSILVEVDSERPYHVDQSEHEFALKIPKFVSRTTPAGVEVPGQAAKAVSPVTPGAPVHSIVPAASAPIEVEYPPIDARVNETPHDATPATSHRFKVKFVAANDAYIDGGSNAGLRIGMDLDIVRLRTRAATTGHAEASEAIIGSGHVVGIATNSAILEIVASDDQLKTGDLAELSPRDAAAAKRNATGRQGEEEKAAATGPLSDPDMVRNSFRSTGNVYSATSTRMSGRIGFDYSGITSSGSTPGSSGQVGMLVETDMQNILGTHWNLEGYWRGRINRHSQFQEATIEETLSKTYTMQLYYDNPGSKWVAGVGRLYLPWAVSLDTVDGGYVGRKSRFGMTTGIFAGSTPDLSSWHYRPNQRIGGLFTNFEGGSYERFHYSSTAGAALSSIGWKLDRPFLFFENELSYGRNIALYHSLIVDSPQGVTTNGIRPGAGVSHSYFTLHYQATPRIGLDLYHNYFRDVPTAATTAVATGLVDKILFQGASAGVHLKPSKHFTLYTTMGLSHETGDLHRSFNRMFGATWFDIAGSGLRADFHYSKFNSNFGNGDYSILTLSRQVTSRMYWNVQLANQDLLSQHTADNHSRFISDSIDVNLGRHTFIQSGYTFVNGSTLNYRQWYSSLGYRFDQGKSSPQYVQTLTR